MKIKKGATDSLQLFICYIVIYIYVHQQKMSVREIRHSMCIIPIDQPYRYKLQSLKILFAVRCYNRIHPICRQSRTSLLIEDMELHEAFDFPTYPRQITH